MVCQTLLTIININPLKLDWAFVALKKNRTFHETKENE